MSTPAPQRGATLIEAMVALLIMAFGMVALVGLQGQIRRTADLAMQRGHATRLAQQEMERLRAFVAINRADLAAEEDQAYEDITARTLEDASPDIGNAQYRLQRSVLDVAEPPRKVLRVTVSWLNRDGGAEFAQVDSMIAPVDPGLSGSLALAPAGSPNRRPGGRHQAIPPGAKDLGDGRSIFKPPALASGVAWVFDNASGLITKRCTGIDNAANTADLGPSDVSNYCTADVNAMLLAGHVRFSTGDVPNPESPLSPALPLNLGIVAIAQGGSVPFQECFDNAPAAADATQTQGVAYYCAVDPAPFGRTPPSWDGRLNILDLPLGGSDYKVCRYSADYDGDTKISNLEHPLNYVKVTGSMAGQNFLVVRATRTCPAGQRVDPSQGRFFDSATIEHQPDPR
jgi:type II secretory pathway pseudopilin PulG